MRLPRALAAIQRGIHERLHLGAQLFVSHHGETVFDDAIGEALPGVGMTRDSINLWMSSVKPVAAVAMAILRDRGMLDYDDPVARHISEFAQHNKSAITIRHLLTHTGGFRLMPESWLAEPWDSIIQRLCAMRPEPSWTPGEKAGYHPRTSWFILGEIVRRIDGRAYNRFAREEVFQPLGMNDSWVGMPGDVYRDYLKHNRFAAMVGSSKALTDATPPEEADCTANRPASNGRGPIRELGKFYEWLLASVSEDQSQIANRKSQIHPNPLPRPLPEYKERESASSPSPSTPGEGRGEGGLRLALSRESIHELIRPHRVGMFDHTFKHNMDWALGFMLNRKRDATMPYTFGPHASARAFGHSGVQSSCAFADPEHGVVVAWVCNAMPGEAKHQPRQLAINTAIYEDLKIAL